MHNTCIEPLLPPENIHLASVNSTELIFSWNLADLNCPSLYYGIQSINCGNCPNETDESLVYCSNFTVSNSITICTFMVQTIICGNSDTPLVGNLSSSESVAVNLTGIIILQLYS